MITQSPNVLSWFLVFALLGAFWYVVDKRFGASLYRWWHNLTHQHPLAESDLRGFIYKQKATIKFSAAVAISLLQSAMATIGGRGSLLEEFITILVEVPALMVGFYFGPQIDKLWTKKDRMLDKVDQFESGAASVSNELREASQKAVDVVREAISDLSGDDSDSEVQAQSKPESEQQNSPEGSTVDSPVDSTESDGEKEVEQDPRSLMDRYLNRE